MMKTRALDLWTRIGKTLQSEVFARRARQRPTALHASSPGRLGGVIHHSQLGAPVPATRNSTLRG